VSDIASTLRRHWLEVAWAVFAVANVAVILLLSEWETIPFHLIWVSLTLLYGLVVWPPRTTAVILTAVVVVTGASLTRSVIRVGEGFDEVAEVPLMAAMFVAMVWHARRRQAAAEEARRRAEREHRLLERQRDFVRHASHELRTPITVARGHAELLRSSSSDPRASADAEIVIDELARLSRLSERLLILAAAERPGPLALERVDLDRFLDDMVRRWSPAAARRWRVECTTTGAIEADPERLGAALDALVENAINATAPGDEIVLAARNGGDVVDLDVVDSGRGIAPEHVSTLFERFSRTDRDRGRSTGGHGLGLAIARAIAEAHGGGVDVQSTPGVGSRFRISLPVRAADEIASGEPA
jgi:signal transduction histidine kinase